MRLLLVANTANALATNARDEVDRWLRAQGISTTIASSGDFCRKSAAVSQLTTQIGSYDLVCVFGGDGAILRTARIVGASRVPLLGFNFGHLGFLAGASGDDPISALQAVFAGEVVHELRTVLFACIEFADGHTEQITALNEIVLARGSSGRVIDVNLLINGVHIADIRGDGIMVATATGSTAYALSAGGPLMAPTHKGLCVVPIAPHTLAARAMVTAPSDVIELLPTAKREQQITVFADGEALEHPKDNDTEIVAVSVNRNPDELLLVRYDAPDFYTAVSQVFFGGGYAR